MKKLLILGGGTGGTILANVMARKLNMREWEIKVIDKSRDHIYQPGLLFLPFALYGYNGPEAVRKPSAHFYPKDAVIVNEEVKHIDHKNRKVTTTNGTHEYDWCVLTMGCHIAPEEVHGLPEAMGKNAFNFYTLDGAMEFQKALAKMEKGRLVLNIAEVPFKCPVAPIEFMYLADYYFHLKGIRKNIEMVYTTPMTGAFTKPIASKVFGDYMAQKGVQVIPNYTLDHVDHARKVMIDAKGQEMPYDILASIPPNRGAHCIDESGLGNGAGFALTHHNTLKSEKADRIFVMGDNTTVPTSKAGSVTHFESEIVVENLLREIEGKEALPKFDGHSNCFIESGFKKAFLIDFNYKIEPVTGKFPIPGIGPFSLLKETGVNHMGKMKFRDLYWNRMLLGKEPAPFGLVTSELKTSGKDMHLLEQK